MGFVVKQIESILTPWTYTDKNLDLEQTILGLLEEKKISIGFVESATGGLAVQRLTRVSGASQVVWGGVVVYQKESKLTLVQVKRDTEGACISASTTRDLALNAQEKFGVHLTAAITGEIKPTGGFDLFEGTFYMGVCDGRPGKSKAYHEQTIQLKFKTRFELQWGATSYLFNLIRKVA